MGPAAAAGPSADVGQAAIALPRPAPAQETGTDGDRARRVKSLLLRDESKTLEFKSWLASRPGAPHDSSGIEEKIAKVLCSLANTEGGDLLVGVGDGGEAEGLAAGGGRLSRKERDNVLLWLTNVIADYFGVGHDGLFDRAIVEADGRDILHCAVTASKDGPLVLKKRLEGKHEFFVRTGSSCRALGLSEVLKYVRTRWPEWNLRPRPMGQYPMTEGGSYAHIVAMGGGDAALWSGGT